MRYQDKTREELQNELEKLQLAYDELKQSFDKKLIAENKSFAEIDKSESRLKDALDDLLESNNHNCRFILFYP